METYDNSPRLLYDMERYGIDQDDWTRYRDTPLWTDPETGADFIRPEDVFREVPSLGEEADLRRATANKFADMINAESRLAVIAP